MHLILFTLYYTWLFRKDKICEYTVLGVFSKYLWYSWLSSKVFATGSVHEEIIQWWNKASVQKPLKCTINSSYSTPLHEIAMKLLENAVWNPILYSEPCGLNDVNEYPFVYKGDQTYIAFY